MSTAPSTDPAPTALADLAVRLELPHGELVDELLADTAGGHGAARRAAAAADAADTVELEALERRRTVVANRRALRRVIAQAFDRISAHGVLTIDDLAALRGCTRAGAERTVAALAAAGTLLVIDAAAAGLLVPAFQFDDTGELRAVVADTNRRLVQRGADVTSLLHWWTSPSPRLGRVPLEALADDPFAVPLAATADGEPGW